MKRRAFLRLAAAGFLAAAISGNFPTFTDAAGAALMALALAGMDVPLAVPMDVGPGDYLPPPTPEPTATATPLPTLTPLPPTGTPVPVFPLYLPELWGGG